MEQGTGSKVFICGMWGLLMTVLVLRGSLIFTIVSAIICAVAFFLLAVFTGKSFEDLQQWSRPLSFATLSPLVAVVLSTSIGWTGLLALSSSAISTACFYRWYHIADLS